MSIRTCIKNHEKLYFWSRVLQGCRQDDFRQRVLDITDHPATARIEHLGDKNPDRLFYLIDLDDQGNHSGFFSLLNDTVKRLELARRLGAEPYIRWQNTSYAGDDDHANNDFIQFFEEPSNATYDEVVSSQNVIISRATDGFPRDDSQVYQERDGFLKKIANLYTKYIHIQPSIKEAIIRDQEKILKERKSSVIGVHVRGGDYCVGLKGHPKQITMDEYEQAIDQVDAEAGEKRPIFLATDDLRVSDHFATFYGDRILSYQDVFRSSQDFGVHYTKDDRNEHGFLLGYEVLRDMDTLSQCERLIAGVSYVSFTARAWRLAKCDSYRSVMIIDHGINQNGISSKEYNRRFNEC